MGLSSGRAIDCRDRAGPALRVRSWGWVSNHSGMEPSRGFLAPWLAMTKTYLDIYSSTRYWGWNRIPMGGGRRQPDCVWVVDLVARTPLELCGCVNYLQIVVDTEMSDYWGYLVGKFPAARMALGGQP